MNILVTGSSGFLGYYLLSELEGLHQINSVGRSQLANIICNLSTETPRIKLNLDVVIHSAGKAHSIPKTPQQKQEFFDVNVTGTKNLLKGLEEAPALPKSIVFISSVAVYGLNSGVDIKENQTLNAKDPYGLSKIHSEAIVQEWCTKNKVICTILRLPLLVGQNPPGNLGDMMKGIKKGYYMNIAGGSARKSMVIAEDVAKIILTASQAGGTYNLTDVYTLILTN